MLRGQRIQVLASERGVPWTIVNPSSVIGDSTTGESDQHLCLAPPSDISETAAQPRCPAAHRPFLPVVTVDHLAALMAATAIDPGAVNKASVGGSRRAADEWTCAGRRACVSTSSTASSLVSPGTSEITPNVSSLHGRRSCSDRILEPTLSRPPAEPRQQRFRPGTGPGPRGQ